MEPLLSTGKSKTKWPQQMLAWCSTSRTPIGTFTLRGQERLTKFHAKASLMNRQSALHLKMRCADTTQKPLRLERSNLSDRPTIETPTKGSNPMQKPPLPEQAFRLSRAVLFRMAAQMQMRRGF
jgi:hypothetical protein